MRWPIPVPDPNDELSSPLLAACQERVGVLWGLHFPPERWRDLVRHLRLVAGEMGISLSACVDALLQNPPPSALIVRCIREFTVGETYFLRDADFFQTLRHEVLLPLIARRRAAQDLRLRIWSAGCCTGEEAYTLAILLAELVPDAKRWQLQIIGSDLNPAFLTAARQGTFGNWSFRQADQTWRQRHFLEEGKGRWRIRDEYRGHVTFLEHNLIHADYPDVTRGMAYCDVILCRNVLMYFTQTQAVAALMRLWNCLQNDGVLFLSSAESMLCQWAGLMPAVWPGALCLQRGVANKSKNAALSGSGDGRASFEHRPSAAALSTVLPIRTATAAGANVANDSADASGLERMSMSVKQNALAAANTARIHANQHQLQQALDWTEHALALDKLDPGHYWLLASLQIEQGAPAQARTTLRKAIYLQPDFVMAHYLSGLLNARLGEPAAAIRDLKNCIRLLEQLSDDSLLPEAEGLSVLDLKKLALNSLERCQDGTRAG